MTDITVLIAGSRPLIRLGLRAALESAAAIRVVAEATCDVEAVRSAAALRPSVMIVDMGLPEMGGARTARLARLGTPDTRVVILGDGAVSEMGPLDVAAPSGLFVPDDIACETLVSVVRQVVAAEADGDEADLEAKPNDGGPVQAHRPLPVENALTDREQEILVWISCGLTNREIARLLALSEHTVKNHVRNILHKLGVKNRTAASVHFMERSRRPLPRLPKLTDIVRQ